MTRGLLLSGGPTHDFDATSGAVVDLLGEEGIATTVLTDPADAVDELRRAGDGSAAPVALLAVNALRWGMAQERYAPFRAEHAFHLADGDAAVLDDFVRSGGGLLALHTAVICFDAHPVWRELCGAAWDWASSTHPPYGPSAVHVSERGRAHPLTAGLDDFAVDDEVYGFLDEVDGLEPLLTGHHGGRDHPLLWARTVGEGRVVTDLLGHGPGSFEHPAHREVLRRAARWAIGAVP